MTAPSFSINGRPIGPGHPPYIIAEVSANHNGEINRAFQVIRAAKAAGADAVKFQTYTADTMTIDHDSAEFRIDEGPWAGQTLYELYQSAATPWEWHEALFAMAKEVGIAAFSTPFDETAVEFLKSLDVPAYKVASFEAIDLPLIDCIARTGKPVIISTGMATAMEIDEAVTAARNAGCSELALLHCVSAYPAEAEDYKLMSIPELLKRQNTIVGLSDHTIGMGVAVSAVTLGATIVEKHLTISRADGGPDSGFSSEPDEFKELCDTLGKIWVALEEKSDNPVQSEEANLMFRRSIYAISNITAGEGLTRENLRTIRPGYGLPPKEYGSLLGRKAKNTIKRGTPISWDLVE
jgi:pseudaminic acid synthase